jgi:L-sorbose 1-phosphate reductase
MSNVPPSGISNFVWPFGGGGVRDLGVGGRPLAVPLRPAAAHEVVARIDAVCICSSDLKIMRMGAQHPLFSGRDLVQSPLVLGHEVALTVCDVGDNWRDTYHLGQRLGLQPAIMRDGRRMTIGIDLPGGFAQYIVLDDHVLGGAEPYVFAVPDAVSAASIAMLEPYACVEAAYRPNCRTSLLPGGRLLVVGGAQCEAMILAADVSVNEAVLLSPPAEVRAWAMAHAAKVWVVDRLDPVGDAAFDDIIVCGSFDADRVQALLPRLADRGMLAIIAPEDNDRTVRVDPARIHYKEISIVGAPGPLIDAAFGAANSRFDLAPGGTTLILGAGGAMGRIHLHRALEIAEGPRRVIATSRKGARLDALRRDFGPLATEQGRVLHVVADDELDALLADIAPDGCEDVVVVVPDAAAVERGASYMRANGMLVIFAGMPFGGTCPMPLGHVAHAGARFTGSTGCTVADQQAILARVMAGSLDLSGNLEAVAGFDALPEAVAAVEAGIMSGKIAIYPAVPDLKLTAVTALHARTVSGQPRWTLSDERNLSKPD